LYPVTVTAYPYQRQNVVLGDGTQLSLTLLYRPMQQGWWVTELTYKGITLNSRRVVVSPNMLHQFREKLPFGLACFSAGNREPTLQQDFSSGAASLFVLTADEVDAFSNYLTGQ
jgi:hypothetical protein